MAGMAGPMTSYFGDPLRRKAWETQIETPVGGVCILCRELVDDGDMGQINFVGQITHYECQMRAVVGSVGHQMGKCSCYGGTEEDPPEMTARQAAIAAAKFFYRNQR